MILLLMLLISAEQPQVQDLWQLRAGNLTETIPAVPGAPLYYNVVASVTRDYSNEYLLDGIDGGDASLTVPLTAILVSQGNTSLAELYWNLEGRDVPATRNDLLDALAWFQRYQLYPLVALNPIIPPDMQGTMHADQCGAVCALGWMTTRSDGLFHGEDLVSVSDIHILSSYFPTISDEMKILTTASLEHIFQSETVLQ